MPKATTKTCGIVVDMPAGGYVAAVTRYPTGRKLPAPRLLADGVLPFRTKALALKALEAWKAEPLGVRHITLEELQPLPEEIVVVHEHKAAAPKQPRRREVRGEPAPLPPAEKLVRIVREPTPTYGNAVATCTGKTVKITKCPPMVCRAIPAGKMMGA